MGKRQMGELSFVQSSPGAPLWELANAVDLTQWKWQPPTLQTPPSRRAPVPGDERSAASDNLFSDWTYSDPTPEAAEDPGNISEDTGSISEDTGSISETELEEPALLESVEPEQEWRIPWDENTDARKVADHALNILRGDVYLHPAFSVTPSFDRFCEYLIHSLANGWFSDDSICLISRYIRASLPKAVGFFGATSLQRRVDDVKFSLSEAMMDGLSARIDNGHATFDERSWNELLMGISEIERNGLRIFGEVMARIPTMHFHSVSSGILANIDTHLTHSGDGTKDASVVRQANKLGDALQRLEPEANADIFASATEEMFCRVGWQPTYERSRLSYLFVLLRIPTVDLNYFFRACATLDSYTSPLTRSDICHLYLGLCRRKYGRWTCSSLLKLLKIHFPDSPECYVDLCTRFWVNDQHEYLAGICHFLQGVSRTQDVFQLARSFTKRIKTPATPLANIAIGIGQPHLAIRVYILFAKSTKQHRHFWNSEFGIQAIKELIHAHTMPRKLLHAAGAFPKSRRKLRKSGKAKTAAITRQQIERVARLAHVLVTSPYLSNRTSLSIVTWCIHYFRYHNAPVPLLVLRSLVFNVTRDLAKGRAGRTSRIQWVLQTVYQHGGLEMASRLQLSLQRWRRKNFEEFKRRGYIDPPGWGA